MRIIVEHDDGTTIDVTEGVKVCFDVVVGSMDWGSGFLDYEEVRAVKTLAISIGLEPPYYTEDGTECATCSHYRSEHINDNWPYLQVHDRPRPCRHRDNGIICPCPDMTKRTVDAPTDSGS